MILNPLNLLNLITRRETIYSIYRFVNATHRPLTVPIPPRQPLYSINRYQNVNNIAVDGGTHRLLRSNNTTGEEADNISSTTDDYDGSAGNPSTGTSEPDNIIAGKKSIRLNLKSINFGI